MTEKRTMTIGEAAAATGLTERALRLYEARGLLAPGRDAGGRRAYGAEEMLALARIAALKRAGFSLAAIGDLLAEGRMDAAILIDAQLAALTAKGADLARSIASLERAKRRLAAGEAPTIDDLCDLIRTGDHAMSADQWKKVYDRYYTEEEQAEWAAAKEKMGESWSEADYARYGEKWEDLGRRIAEALPLDPRSNRAQAFLAEWDALLKPFMEIASPTMKENAGRLWDNADEWRGEVDTTISPEVLAFIKAAAEAKGE